LKEEAMVCAIERTGISVILPKYGFEGFIDYNEEEIETNRKLIAEIG
jgi:S1 domain